MFGSREKSPYQPDPGSKPADPQALELETLRRQAAELSRKRVADAEMTLAFLSSNQWVEYLGWDVGISPVDNATNEIRITDNRMLNISRRRMKYLFREKPVIVCHAAGTELRDDEVAAAASSVCDHFETNCGFRDAMRDQVSWGGVAGVGYVMPIWKTIPGRTRRVRRRELDPDGHETPDGRISYIREREVAEKVEDVSFVSLCPLSTYTFPFHAKKWTDVTAIMYCEMVDEEQIKRLLPDVDMKDLTPVSPEAVNLDALERISQYVSPEFGYARNITQSQGLYMLMHYWERPCGDDAMKDGRYRIVVGGRTIHDNVLPHVEEAREVDPMGVFNLEMGVVPFNTMDMPGRLIPPGTLAQLRPHQIRINQLLTDEAQNRQSVGRNKLIAQKNSVDRDAWTDEHGEMIEINDRGSTMIKPQFIQAPPLVGLGEELSRAQYSLEEASGQTNVTRGRNDTQVRAAWQLEILLEESMTLVSDEADHVERAYELAARLALAIVARRYSKERVVEIVGADRQGYAVSFLGANLTSDIRVQKGSMTPRNHALKKQTLMELAGIGVFNDKQSGKLKTHVLLDALELGTLNQSMHPDLRQRIRARSESTMMLVDGILIAPETHEDHALHIEEHISDMARPEWYAASDDRKVITKSHVEMHRQMLASQLAPETSSPVNPVSGLGDLLGPTRMRSPQRGAGSAAPGMQQGQPSAAGGQGAPQQMQSPQPAENGRMMTETQQGDA